MTYTEWRDELKSNLLSVSEAERKRVLEYYAEAYADRREAGFSEREIIEEFGAPYDAAQRILQEDVSDKAPRTERISCENAVPAQREESAAAIRATPQEDQVQPAGAKEKKQHKTLWIVLGCVIPAVALFIVFVIAAFALNGWMVMPEFEMEQYTAQEEITELQIDNAVGNVKTEFYDGDRIAIDYPVSDIYTMRIEEKDNGTLTISGLHKKHWYNVSLRPVSFPETVVKIPQNTVLKLDVKVNAGEVYLASGVYAEVSIKLNAGSLKTVNIICSSFDCEINAGAVFVNLLDCKTFDCEVNAGSFNAVRLVCPNIKIDVSAGSFKAEVQGKKEDYTILVDKSAGSCNVSSQTGTDPEKKIDIDVSAGSVEVRFVL